MFYICKNIESVNISTVISALFSWSHLIRVRSSYPNKNGARVLTLFMAISFLSNALHCYVLETNSLGQ